MIVVGLDVSLTSSGLARINTESGEWITRRLRSKAAHGVRAQARRIEQLAAQIARFTEDVHPDGGGAAWPPEPADAIAIEGLANYGRQTGSAAGLLSGLWWQAIGEISRASSAPIFIVAPASRAKYACGSGRGTKSEVLATVRETYPEADVPQHDIADAVAMAAMIARIKGSPVERVERSWVEETARRCAERFEKEKD